MRYLSKPVTCGFSRRAVIVARSMAPVGQTNAQAPQAWHWSVGSSKAVRTSRAVPRPKRLIAPRPIISLHTRVHSPQRMHLPSAAGWNGVDSTPSPAANSASSRESGAWASSSSSTVRRDSLTRSVSVWTTRLALDRVAARGDQLAAARRLDLDQADAAGAVRRQPAIVAQRGDRDAHLPRGVEDRRAPGDLRRAAVDVHQNPIRCGCVHSQSFTSRFAGTARYARATACRGRVSSHTPAGHCLWRMCVSNSSRKCSSVVSTAPGAMPPMPHTAADFTVLASRSRSARSAAVPLALADPRQDAVHLLGALAAGNALAARLFQEEADEEPGHVDHAGACRPAR